MNALKLKRAKFNITNRLPELNPPISPDPITEGFKNI